MSIRRDGRRSFRSQLRSAARRDSTGVDRNAAVDSGKRAGVPIRYAREAEGLGSDENTRTSDRRSRRFCRKALSDIFAQAELDRRVNAMIAFIDASSGSDLEVEPICKVLPIAPSTYHAHIAQRVDASKRSARAQSGRRIDRSRFNGVFAENLRRLRRAEGLAAVAARRLHGCPLHRRAS